LEQGRPWASSCGGENDQGSGFISNAPAGTPSAPWLNRTDPSALNTVLAQAYKASPAFLSLHSGAVDAGVIPVDSHCHHLLLGIVRAEMDGPSRGTAFVSIPTRSTPDLALMRPSRSMPSRPQHGVLEGSRCPNGYQAGQCMRAAISWNQTAKRIFPGAWKVGASSVRVSGHTPQLIAASWAAIQGKARGPIFRTVGARPACRCRCNPHRDPEIPTASEKEFCFPRPQG